MDLVKDPYIVNIVNPFGFDLNITKNILNDSCESQIHYFSLNSEMLLICFSCVSDQPECNGSCAQSRHVGHRSGLLPREKRGEMFQQYCVVTIKHCKKIF